MVKPLSTPARTDGGFGPIGSGGVAGNAGKSAKPSYRSFATGWNADRSGATDDPFRDPDDRYESGRSTRSRSRGGFRSEYDEDESPQFLVEEDLYGEDYGGTRLVAPAVLGEDPSGFRDF